MIVSAPLIVATVVVAYLISSIHILKEYERGVIFRLGSFCRSRKAPASSWSSGP